MRGPHGKGYAEMAVARVPGLGFETPMLDDDRQRYDEFQVSWNQDTDILMQHNELNTKFTTRIRSNYSFTIINVMMNNPAVGSERHRQPTHVGHSPEPALPVDQLPAPVLSSRAVDQPKCVSPNSLTQTNYRNRR